MQFIGFFVRFVPTVRHLDRSCEESGLGFEDSVGLPVTDYSGPSER